jgi:hypothetical protein
MVDLAISETIDAITSDTDRIIGVFAIPLLVAVFATGAMATVYLNQGKAAIFNALLSSGVCNTIQPYLITSVMGSFQGDPLAHVAMCQIAQFNPLVFLAWYVEVLGIVLLTIFIFESITHMG